MQAVWVRESAGAGVERAVWRRGSPRARNSTTSTSFPPPGIPAKMVKYARDPENATKAAKVCLFGAPAWAPGWSVSVNGVIQDYRCTNNIYMRVIVGCGGGLWSSERGAARPSPPPMSRYAHACLPSA